MPVRGPFHWVTVAALGALGLAACGSSATSASTSSSPPARSTSSASTGSRSSATAATGTDTTTTTASDSATASVSLIAGSLLCNALTTDQVKQAIGLDSTPAANDQSGQTECDYTTSDGRRVVTLTDSTSAVQEAARSSSPDAIAAFLLAIAGTTAVQVQMTDAAFINLAPPNHAKPGVFLFEKGHYIGIELDQTPAQGDVATAATALATSAAAFISTQPG